jgi:hemerythrin-like domain-containing protein
MSMVNEENIAVAFRNIHDIISRGLKVSIENVQDVIHTGFHDTSRREGLFNYIRALCSVLNAHHLTEDELAFPYFRDKIPEAPFDRLMVAHREMVKILDEIKPVLEKSDKTGELGARLRLENALIRLNEAWQLHIRMETDVFISKTDALIPADEQLRLVGLFAQNVVKLSGPLPLTVPFLLLNLPPEDRRVFSRDLPAEIVQHLVPVIWKVQWASMNPFLLT